METVTAKIDVNGEQETITEYLTYSRAHEVIFTLFCFIGLCADFIIIYTLFRFRRMHTVPNIFLSNWIIADACYLFCLALYYIISIIMMIIGNKTLSMNYYFCGHVQMAAALYFATVYFVTLVSIDWLIATYFQRYIETFRSYYKFSIGFIWIFSFVFWGVTTGLCFKTESFEVLSGYTIFIMFVVSVFFITIQIYTVVQKFQNRPLESECTTLMLTLASIYVLCRAPDFIQFVVYVICDVYSVILEVLIMYITPLHSSLNLFLLYWLNKDFQACLRQFLNRSDQRYMEASSAFENDDENEEPQFPVRISLNNSNEALSPNAY